MSEMPTGPVLGYDQYQPRSDPRRIWVIPVFWMGALAMNLVYCAILLYLNRSELWIQILLEALLIPVMISVVPLPIATLALGLCMWLRLKFVREFQYASFRTTFWSGMILGAYPLAMLRVLPREWWGWWWLGALVWSIVYSTCAGFWLARRSAVRD